MSSEVLRLLPAVSDDAAIAAARLLCLVAALGACASCLEWCCPWSKLEQLGALDRRRHGRGGWRSFWHPRGTRALLLARLACASVTATALLTRSVPVAWAGGAALLAGVFSLALRADEPVGVQVGLDGGEHLLMVCLLCVGGGLALGTGAALQAALAFVAFQALLEYASAGWIKLRSWRGWLEGTFLQRVLAASSYGNPALFRLVRRRPRAAAVLSGTVIALELLLPATPWLPRPYAELALGMALLFHAGNAAVMGLNSFVWGFGAAFPAILFCRDWLLS